MSAIAAYLIRWGITYKRQNRRRFRIGFGDAMILMFLQLIFPSPCMQFEQNRKLNFFHLQRFFLILWRFRLKPCSRLTKSKRSNTSHELLTEPSVGSKIRLLFWSPPLQCRCLSFQNTPWGHVSNADSALSHNSSLWPFSVLKIAVFSLSSNSTTKVEFYVAE